MSSRTTRSTYRQKNPDKSSGPLDSFVYKSKKIPGMTDTPTHPPGIKSGEAEETSTVLAELKSLSSQFTTMNTGLNASFKKLEKKVEEWKTDVQSQLTAALAKTAEAVKVVEESKPVVQAAKDLLEKDTQYKQDVETRISELENKILNLDTEDLENNLQTIKNKMKKAINHQKRVENELEREIRKKNFKINGVQENRNENVFQVAKTALEKLTETSLDCIVSVLRMGKKDREASRPRPILIKCKDVKSRNVLYKDCKKNKEKHKEVYIQHHLTKMDMLTRNRALPLMKEAQENGIPHEFINGRLRVNGKYVDIPEETGDQDQEEQ